MEFLLKGKGECLELVFKHQTSIEQAVMALKELTEDKDFYKKSNAKITYSGAEFTVEEEMRLYKCVCSVFGKGISFQKKKRVPYDDILYSLEENESLLTVIKRTIRSGEEIFCRGDAIIYGDVNSGAVIKASGNITVIGTLRGTAITKKGTVFALQMQPSQIRIGNVYSYNKKSENAGAALAKAKKGEIFLECL